MKNHVSSSPERALNHHEPLPPNISPYWKFTLSKRKIILSPLRSGYHVNTFHVEGHEEEMSLANRENPSFASEWEKSLHLSSALPPAMKKKLVNFLRSVKIEIKMWNRARFCFRESYESQNTPLLSLPIDLDLT